jgi:hypothetical protein
MPTDRKRGERGQESRPAVSRICREAERGAGEGIRAQMTVGAVAADSFSLKSCRRCEGPARRRVGLGGGALTLRISCSMSKGMSGEGTWAAGLGPSRPRLLRSALTREPRSPLALEVEEPAATRPPPPPMAPVTPTAENSAAKVEVLPRESVARASAARGLPDGCCLGGAEMAGCLRRTLGSRSIDETPKDMASGHAGAADVVVDEVLRWSWEVGH